MTREEAFAEINQLQDGYIDGLVCLMNDPSYESMKFINFTSPTGTGKTKMMSKLINRFPDVYFIITTLSKGQLHIQVRESLLKDCHRENFYVYGSCDYKINSKLDAQDIIGRIPDNTQCIWLRDEGHIRTNRFDELLLNVCHKVINFSATNLQSDIQCNFTSTMMLRTVVQSNGTPFDAMCKLKAIKESHKNVHGYNPCAIFRCVSGDSNLYNMIVDLCNQYHFKYIDITDSKFDMSELCQDDNEYDVIINKFKIVEGIDIRRAHVLYMDNQPSNNATTIQVIGRCRRNALLYRNDIDILAPDNKSLLNDTRTCYVYYNVDKMRIDTDSDGELQYAFCDSISCEALNAGSKIDVIDGQLPNGLHVIELAGCTGKYEIKCDDTLGFNYVEPITQFYNTVEISNDRYVYTSYRKIRIDNITKLPIFDHIREFDYSCGKYVCRTVERPYYILEPYIPVKYISDAILEVDDDCIEYFIQKASDLNECFTDMITVYDMHDTLPEHACMQDIVNTYLETDTLTPFRNVIEHLEHFVTPDGSDDVAITDICDCDDMLVMQYCLIQMELKYPRRTAEYAQHSMMIFLHICQALQLIRSEKDLEYHNNVQNLICWFFSDPDQYLWMTFDRNFPVDYEKDISCHVTLSNVDKYFQNIYRCLSGLVLPQCSISYLQCQLNRDVSLILQDLRQFRNKCCTNRNFSERLCACYDFLFEDLTDEDRYLVSRKYVAIAGIQNDSPVVHPWRGVRVDVLSNIDITPYTKIVNDYESAVIGTDLMRQVKIDDDIQWIEDKAVSSKVRSYNKFNQFITRRYAAELEFAKSLCFSGKNTFKLDKKCNSVIGYCVEYYSKYLVYGKSYLGHFIQDALKESSAQDINDAIIVRACMLKYQQMMAKSFGRGIVRLLPTISVDQLIRDGYSDFVNLVITLGSRTATYVRSALYVNAVPKNNVDPNLSIRHIAGLADYITLDTILDVKVCNHIDEKFVRQVLAYHYLSTKRSDLDIQRVIVYDAVSDKAVEIDISDVNLKALSFLDAQLEND